MLKWCIPWNCATQVVTGSSSRKDINKRGHSLSGRQLLLYPCSDSGTLALVPTSKIPIFGLRLTIVSTGCDTSRRLVGWQAVTKIVLGQKVLCPTCHSDTLNLAQHFGSHDIILQRLVNFQKILECVFRILLWVETNMVNEKSWSRFCTAFHKTTPICIHIILNTLVWYYCILVSRFQCGGTLFPKSSCNKSFTK